MSLNTLSEEQIFYKGGTAALLVMSPFQLLCAREAVREFEFEDYKYVLLLYPPTEKRNQQMLNMVCEWKAKFDQYCSTDITIKDYFSHKGIIFKTEAQCTKYDRIFIGDHGSQECRMLARKYAKKNTIISFLDDGTASIFVLNNIFCCTPQSDLWADVCKWYRLRYSTRNRLQKIDRELNKYQIKVTNSFFTVFSDISPTRFHTHQNTFKELVSSTQQFNDIKSVYIIGSPTNDFLSMYGIDIDYLNEIIRSQLIKARKQFPNERLVYIPHPRDNNKQIVKYCEELNITYTLLETTSEDYLRSRKDSIIAVYGFGSSTLINLKRMFPELIVIDIVIYNPRKKYSNAAYDVINNYYSKNGIEVQKIIIPDDKNRIQEPSFFCNIISLIHYITKGKFK